jgi:Fe-Mn family superoxide dismutase
MTFKLPELPYAKDALSPHISERTMSFHYGKHHKGYVDKLNAALESIDYAGDDLFKIVRESYERGDTGVFNNAAQTWNHTFFWQSMTPNSGDVSDDKLKEAIEAFGGMAKLRETFVTTGMGRFGSGWAWLVQKDNGTLDVMSTPNAEPPQLHGLKPLLTCDVWEHAYYLDYQNDRKTFIEVFFDSLANWSFAAERLHRDGME